MRSCLKAADLIAKTYPVTHSTLFLILSSFLSTVYVDKYNWVNIDCGAATSYTDSKGIDWKTDDQFIGSGQNKQVTKNALAVSEQMDTLRFFGNRNKDCYSIPTPVVVKYLVRAGFFYGNYDGLGKPPVFDLVFDANKWVTVTTSIDQPLVYEMIYAGTGDSISICIARTNADQVPFISSLELIPLGENTYSKMNRNYAWFLNYRSNFGGPDVIGYPDDDYDRTWSAGSTPGLTPVVANFSEVVNPCPDDPPSSVILHGVQAAADGDPITLQFDFPGTSRTNYLALYYIEVIQLNADQKRSFTISVDGQDYGPTVTPQYETCGDFNITTNPASGIMNLTISPTDDSTLAPLISAAEVFTLSAALVQGTNQDDMVGLQSIMKSFSRQQAWAGDPCLPNNTVWEWLTCNTNDPPRVTSLKLSGYGLGGGIPDFSQMQALEIINMDHNSLTGRIPDFLGNLPQLKLLNLSYNNLDTEVPSSLRNNRTVCDLTGNNPDPGNPGPNPPGGGGGNPAPKENKHEVLWSLLGLVFICIGIWRWKWVHNLWHMAMDLLQCYGSCGS